LVGQGEEKAREVEIPEKGGSIRRCLGGEVRQNPAEAEIERGPGISREGEGSRRGLGVFYMVSRYVVGDGIRMSGRSIRGGKSQNALVVGGVLVFIGKGGSGQLWEKEKSLQSLLAIGNSLWVVIEKTREEIRSG